MSSIEYLQVENNDISQVPVALTQMRKLTSLSLQNNKLKCLRDEFCDMGQLQCLQLHNNNLETLPENFDKLKQLRELSLHDNPLKNPPSDWWSVVCFSQLEDFFGKPFSEKVRHTSSFQLYSSINIMILYKVKLCYLEIIMSLFSRFTANESVRGCESCFIQT